MKRVSISLDLCGSNRRARRTWTEETEEPDTVTLAIEKALAELQGRPLVKPGRPRLLRRQYLCWEPGDSVRLPEDFWLEVGALSYQEEPDLQEAVQTFWTTFGPLWPSHNYRLPWGFVRNEIKRFRYLVGSFWVGTVQLKRGLPPPLGFAENLLSKMIQIADLACEAPGTTFTIAAVTEDDSPVFAPAGEDEWFVIPPPPSTKGRPGQYFFPDRETGVRWLREAVLVPAAARLLRKAVRFVPVLSASDTVTLEASCDSAFALAVAQMVLGTIEWSLCGCGCGALVPPGRKYASEACRQRAKNAKPYKRLLCYLNTQRNRGKITEEQCKKGHTLAKKLRTRHDDYEELKRAVLDQLK